MAYNINGTVHSWESGGWSQSPLKDYLRDNKYRDGVGYVLGDENDPDWADDMAQKILSFQGDGEGIIQKILGTGPYALRQDNCGEAFCRAVNSTQVSRKTTELLQSSTGSIFRTICGPM